MRGCGASPPPLVLGCSAAMRVALTARLTRRCNDEGRYAAGRGCRGKWAQVWWQAGGGRRRRRRQWRRQRGEQRATPMALKTSIRPLPLRWQGAGLRCCPPERSRLGLGLGRAWGTGGCVPSDQKSLRKCGVLRTALSSTCPLLHLGGLRPGPLDAPQRASRRIVLGASNQHPQQSHLSAPAAVEP